MGRWSTVLAVKTLRVPSAQQQAAVEDAREVVDSRIADVHGDRVATVPLDDRRQPACDLGERLLPGGRAQLAVAADQRPVQAVGVVVGGRARFPWGR